MDISKAIKARQSIRCYLNKPVNKSDIESILNKSLRAPSATNIQPWNIYVVTGEILDLIKKENSELFYKGTEPTVMEPDLFGPFKDRRKELGKGLFTLLEIGREDEQKKLNWGVKGHRYFDAPVALILTMGNYAKGENWSLIGIGSIIQTICLEAMQYGLGTCIAEQGVSYHDVLRKYLNIAEEETIVVSIAIGYPDMDAIENKFISKRENLDKIAHFIGF